MSKDNAKRVVRVATIYPAFRTALRADPAQAMSLFAKDLHLEGENPLDENEIKALVSISDEEYAALARIAASLGDSLENGEAPMSCFML